MAASAARPRALPFTFAAFGHVPRLPTSWPGPRALYSPCDAGRDALRAPNGSFPSRRGDPTGRAFAAARWLARCLLNVGQAGARSLALGTNPAHLTTLYPPSPPKALDIPLLDSCASPQLLQGELAPPALHCKRKGGARDNGIAECGEGKTRGRGRGRGKGPWGRG